MWAELESSPVSAHPWILVGDFNYIQDDGECIGGESRPLLAMEEFNRCIDDCGLLELKAVGGDMSWTNGQEGISRKWAKLDQAVVNTAFMHFFPLGSIQYLQGKARIISRC